MGAGRPSKYDEKYCDQAYKLTLLGATDSELAEFFEVNEDTVHEWKKRHPKFSESIKEGKAKADAEVANKLFHRALGYEVEEVAEVMYKGKKETLISKRQVPPDVTSMIFWLKNRRPDAWRDKQEIDMKTTLIEVVIKE